MSSRRDCLSLSETNSVARIFTRSSTSIARARKFSTGAVHMDTVADVWSSFKRSAVGTFHEFRRDFRSKLRHRIPPSSRPATRTEIVSPGRESWLLKEPKWFAAVLAFVVLAVVEVLSWEAANWPLCLLTSKYRAGGGCATFLEGVAQFVEFLWDNADRNGVTAVAAIVIAFF